jgi:hypothetical protein
MTYHGRHIVAAMLALWPGVAAAQSFEAVGTRAAGMGGAFVAVADDASAVYWNPAGFASGNLLSIVVDRLSTESDPAVPEGARKGSGFMFALGMPALAITYYQVRSTAISPSALKSGVAGADEPDQLRVDTLVTHHTGATVVQSVGSHFAIGGTAKLVRGIASSALVPDGARETVLDEADELGGNGSTKFDADVGVMASGPFFKAGLTVRNLTNPRFDTAGERGLELARQVRAGVALVPVVGWVIDTDVDLTTTPDISGDRREVAVGVEGRFSHKGYVRSGFRVNTTGPSRTAYAVGTSYMIVNSVFVDTQVTHGHDQADRGWSFSVRLVY